MTPHPPGHRLAFRCGVQQGGELLTVQRSSGPSPRALAGRRVVDVGRYRDRTAGGFLNLLGDLGEPSLDVDATHVHDLRHTGNQLAVDMGVSTKNLTARMGHDNKRAALRYRHRSAKGDRIIADGLDALVREERHQDNDDGVAAGTLVPVA